MRAREARRAARLLAALAGVWVAACTAPPVIRDGVPVPARQAAEDDLRGAREALARRDADAAERALERFLHDFPGSRRVDEAWLLRGEARLLKDDPAGAVRAWRKLLEDWPHSRFQPHASLRLATLYQTQGRLHLARGVIDEAAVERAPHKLRGPICRKRADLARETEDYPAAVEALALALRHTDAPDEVFAIQLELEELVHGRLRDAELADLAPRLPRGPVHDSVLLELARRALARHDLEAARSSLGGLPGRLRPADELERQRLRDWIEAGGDDGDRALGLALPLSGPYAAYGQAVLRGAVLGLRILEDPPAAYRLLVRDTAGEPARAPEVVRELAGAGVRAVVGPMRSVEAAAAAHVAEQERVPLLTLARREDLSYMGDWVFRLGPTAEDEVRALLDHAMGTLALRRFAVLYPRDAYGTLWKNIFWEEVERRGGEVVGVEGYAVDAVDLQNEVKKLVGLYYLTPGERALVKERESLRRHPERNRRRLQELASLPPWVDFDALAIPDQAGKVALILPYFQYVDMRGVLFLGPSGWNERALVEHAAREAEGSVFVDVFSPRSDDPDVVAFAEAYRSAYGEEPGASAAEGYDVAVLLRTLLDGAGHGSREGLRRALLEVRDFPGVSGVVSIDESGAARKRLRLLTVEGGEIRELVPTPAD